VTILDLTALRSGDPLNHSGYANNPRVVRHIGQRLIEGKAISDFDASQIDMLGQVPR
jgi:esterase/lipase superfamily enzyme